MEALMDQEEAPALTTSEWAGHRSTWYSIETCDKDGDRRAATIGSIAVTINEALAQGHEALATELVEAPPLNDDIKAEHLQLRSSPLPALGGGELRFDVPPAAFDDAEFADDVLYATRTMGAFRPVLSQSVAELRRLAKAAIARHRCNGAPVRTVAIGVRAAPTLLACFDGVIELEVLGHGLTPTIARVEGYGFADMEEKLDALLIIHSRRAALLSSLQAAGDRGLIEGPARRVLELSDMSLDVALEHLEKRNRLSIRYMGFEGLVGATLYWRDGILKADFYGGNGVWLCGGVIRVLRTLPANVVATRPGKRLGRLVRDSHLSPDLIVTGSWRRLGDTDRRVGMPGASDRERGGRPRVHWIGRAGSRRSGMTFWNA
jgi:hypothetical protein